MKNSTFCLLCHIGQLMVDFILARGVWQVLGPEAKPASFSLTSTTSSLYPHPMAY